jgi:hemolysin-activating ACP:hemolysin acyltransferase
MSEPLKCSRAENDMVALGIAANMLHNSPPFDGLSARNFIGTLLGQISRKHYVFTMRGEKILGYAGWALCTEEIARAWSEGRYTPKNEESIDGPCVMVVTFFAENPEATRFQAQYLRRLKPDAALIGRREYADGRLRPLVLPGQK